MILLILFAVVFLGALWRPIFGAAVVLLSRCVLPLPWLYMPLSGLGGIELSDVALLGLSLGVLWQYREGFFARHAWLWGVVFWFAMASFYTFAAGLNPDSRRSDALNEFVRFGLCWVIPMAIDGGSRRNRHQLLICCALVAGLTACVQMYVILTGDQDLLVRWLRMEEGSAIKVGQLAEAGGLYKANLPGMFVVVAVFFFCLAALMLRWQETRSLRWPLLALAFGCGATIFSFRSKSLGAVVAVGILILLVFESRSSMFGVIRLVFLAAVLALGFWGVEAWSKVNFFQETVERFKSDLIFWNEGSIGVRIGDNIQAAKLAARFPVFGVGKPSVTFESGFDYTVGSGGFEGLGYDGHALLMLAQFIGLPGALMAGLALTRLVLRIPWKHLGRAPWITLGCVTGFTALLVLSMGNASPVFSQRPELTAFMVFWGLVLADVPRLADCRGMRTSKLKHPPPKCEPPADGQRTNSLCA